MAILIFLVLFAIPFVEIALFIEIGGRIGLWNTLALVVLTALAGAWLLRMQGFCTLRRVRESLARNVFPAAELFDGLCLLIAGVLLLTPGFFTDALGLLLMIPPVRHLMRVWAWWMISRHEGTRVCIDGEEVTRGPRGSDIIDGDYRVIDPSGSDDSRPRPR